MVAYTVSSGQTSSGVFLGPADTETVLSGGVATATVAEGWIYARSGGVTTGSVISVGGGEAVFEGGNASGTVIRGNGQFVDGGTAVGTIVGSGGTETLSAGITISTMIGSGGMEAVRFGTASAATVLCGGAEIVSMGGRAVATDVASGGVLIVLPGAAASETIVETGGTVLSTGVYVASGTSVPFYSSDTASGLVISGGPVAIIETVLPGGLALDTVLVSAGWAELSSGAATSGTIIMDGGVEYVSWGAVTHGTRVRNGGEQVLSDGGLAHGTTVSSGGFQAISGISARAIGTEILGGGAAVYSGGSASGTTIGAGGLQIVGQHGMASGSVIASGGEERVFSGGVTSGALVESGGTETILGSIASSAIVERGATLFVTSSGSSVGTAIRGGGVENVAWGVASGTVVTAGGILAVTDFAGVASGTVIGSGGVEYLSAGFAYGTVIGNGGVQVVASGSNPSGTVLHPGGTIDVRFLPFAAGGSASVAPTVDVLSVTEGGRSYSQRMSGSYAGLRFALADDGAGGTLVTAEDAPCFVRGTRILTARGEVAVEDLQRDDRAVTLAGQGPVLKPVTWIGRRRLDLRRHPAPERARPIRIFAGALDEGVPHRDLRVSPDHALYLEGVLVHADTLVNGATIVQEAPPEVEYFHVELASHDVILADGAPVESYLDTGNRAQFNNNPVTALRPEFAPAAAADACAPYRRDGAAWRDAAARILARAEALGWTRSDDPDLHLSIDGREVRPTRASHAPTAPHRFVLPKGCRDVWILSRASRPSAVQPGSEDRRRLGVGVGALRLLHGGAATEVTLDDPALADGFSYPESDGTLTWRWTDGAARLPPSVLAPADAGGVLEIVVAHTLPYWIPPFPAAHQTLAR